MDEEAKKPVKSPIQMRRLPVKDSLAQALLQQLKKMRAPVPRRLIEGRCRPECHIIERNSTLDEIENFVRHS